MSQFIVHFLQVLNLIRAPACVYSSTLEYKGKIQHFSSVLQYLICYIIMKETLNNTDFILCNTCLSIPPTQHILAPEVVLSAS